MRALLVRGACASPSKGEGPQRVIREVTMSASLCRPYARWALLVLPFMLWNGACSRSPKPVVLTADMLAKQFKPGSKVALTPEQLERLRSPGYIR